MNLRHLLSAAVLALAACAGGDRPTPPQNNMFVGAPLSTQSLMEHIRVLSSDAFEGRAPGTNGERLTIEYL